MHIQITQHPVSLWYIFAMKTFVLLTVLTIVLLIEFSAHAYVPPLDFILSKTVEQSGKSIISIEQNVIFNEETPEGVKEHIVKEQWLIEGDKNLRLTAIGTGELKDSIKIHYLYNNKKRIQISGKNNVIKEISPDFFEKFSVIKTSSAYQTYLKELNITPDVRLSRASGAISFAIGELSTEDLLKPQVWIDQDFFRLNKIRFSSNAEVEFSNYKEYDSLHYPDLKTISWADKTVTIKVTKVSTKTKSTIKNFYPKTLELPSQINLSDRGSIGQTIEEFYTRFR